MGRVADLQARLFPKQVFVCGGHGAWKERSAGRLSAGFTQVPPGITVYFYVRHGDALGNAIGQQVDQILAGGAAPAAVEVATGGQMIRDYHLFTSRAGGYLNLAMSSSADPRYITSAGKDNGLPLSAILKRIAEVHPSADVHWSACRSVEAWDDRFDWDKPEYSAALLKLGKPAVKAPAGAGVAPGAGNPAGAGGP